MDNIKNILEGVIKDLSKTAPKKVQAAEKVWLSTVGDKEKPHTAFVGEKNKNLFIHVDSPTWLYHMRTRKNTLLKKIQMELPHIKNIVFKVGKLT